MDRRRRQVRVRRKSGRVRRIRVTLATDCDEGELVWLKKAELLTKKMWAGDRIFLKALDERRDFFSLKLRYRGEELVEAKFG